MFISALRRDASPFWLMIHHIVFTMLAEKALTNGTSFITVCIHCTGTLLSIEHDLRYLAILHRGAIVVASSVGKLKVDSATTHGTHDQDASLALGAIERVQPFQSGAGRVAGLGQDLNGLLEHDSKRRTSTV